MASIKRAVDNPPRTIHVGEGANRVRAPRVRRAAGNQKQPPKKLKAVVVPGAIKVKKAWVSPPRHGVLEGQTPWEKAEPGSLIVAKVDLYGKMDRSKHFDGEWVLTKNDYDPGRGVQLPLMVKAGTFGIFIERATVEVESGILNRRRMISISRFHINNTYCTSTVADAFEIVRNGEEEKE